MWTPGAKLNKTKIYQAWSRSSEIKNSQRPKYLKSMASEK
jgi:hypothetical protein